jgi:hypothetical protein
MMSGAHPVFLSCTHIHQSQTTHLTLTAAASSFCHMSSRTAEQNKSKQSPRHDDEEEKEEEEEKRASSSALCSKSNGASPTQLRLHHLHLSCASTCRCVPFLLRGQTFLSQRAPILSLIENHWPFASFFLLTFLFTLQQRDSPRPIERQAVVLSTANHTAEGLGEAKFASPTARAANERVRIETPVVSRQIAQSLGEKKIIGLTHMQATVHKWR